MDFVGTCMTTATTTPGSYRRRVHLRAQDQSVAAALEDDFHHFTLTLNHDGVKVTSIRAEALRHPFTTCPGAVDELQRLMGAPLTPSLIALQKYANAREHCTHLFELAGLAIAHAARGLSERRYDLEVSDPIDGQRRAKLDRDGAAILDWTLAGQTVVAPEPFANRAVRTLLPWAFSHLDSDGFEAVVLLRRALWVSGGRGALLDEAPLEPLKAQMVGACYSFQPKVAVRAERAVGSSRDFTFAADQLLRRRD
jgi:hypothetical protein